MLILSRKVGEQVIIDQDIAVTVVEISGGRIKLGIEAPRERTILRGELQAPHRSPPAPSLDLPEMLAQACPCG